MKKGGKKDKRQIEKKGKKIKEKVLGKKSEEKKEIKEIRKEKNLEEEISEDEEETSERNFSGFLQPQIIGKTVPVLDKIAFAENTNLEQQLANVTTREKDKEESQLNYGGKNVDYGAATGNLGREKVKYETEAPNYNALGKNKKDDDKNRLIEHGIKNEWKENDREERWQMEETPGEKYFEDKKYG